MTLATLTKPIQGNTAPLMDIVEQINAHSRANHQRMTTQQHNQAEEAAMQRALDGFKWHLGVELGIDPRSSREALIELELRFAHWLLNEGGGAWLEAEFIKPNHKQIK